MSWSDHFDSAKFGASQTSHYQRGKSEHQGKS